MMIGLEVAPVAPRARFVATASGSMESSHSLVPQAIRDRSGLVMIVISTLKEAQTGAKAAQLKL